MTDDDDALRAAFAARSQDVQGPSCPTPEALLRAFTGQAPRGERRAVVAHLATCAACAEDWRLAREIMPDEAGAQARDEQPEAAPVVVGPWLRSGLIALAAALVAAAGVGLWPRLVARPPAVYRETQSDTPRALVPDDAALPRDAFELRWAFAQADARYAVTLSDAALEALFEARDLEQSAVLVPAAALGALSDGATLLWQVEARLPDGRQARSSTFRVRIGPARGRGTQTR